MPLLKDGDQSALQQFVQLFATLSVVSCVVVYTEWGVIDKLVELDILSEEWTPLSDNSFRHYIVYLGLASKGVFRLSRSHLGLSFACPSEIDEDEHREPDLEWHCPPGMAVPGGELRRTFNACLGRPFDYFTNNCQAFSTAVLRTMRVASAVAYNAPMMAPSRAPLPQADVTPITWLPPGGTLPSGLLAGAIKLRGYNFHTGMATPASLMIIGGVLRVYAPSATAVSVISGCINICFVLQCSDMASALKEMQLLHGSNFLSMHLLSVLATIATPTGRGKEEIASASCGMATSASEPMFLSPEPKRLFHDAEDIKSRSWRRGSRAKGSAEPTAAHSKMCNRCNLYYGNRTIECPVCLSTLVQRGY